MLPPRFNSRIKVILFAFTYCLCNTFFYFFLTHFVQLNSTIGCTKCTKDNNRPKNYSHILLLIYTNKKRDSEESPKRWYGFKVRRLDHTLIFIPILCEDVVHTEDSVVLVSTYSSQTVRSVNVWV